MSNGAAHKSGWQIFEVVFGVPFLVALALQWLIPLSFPGEPFSSPYLVAGAILIPIGIRLVVMARQEFSKYSQPTDPGRPTGQIVTTGIFSVSRNPLYLGGIFVLAGISLALDLPWAFILLIPSIVACHYILILPEERYLSAKFGEPYRIYMATVQRWIGRK